MGLVEAMFNEPSLLDDSPLVPTLHRILEPFSDSGIQRAFTLAAVDENNGDYVTWTELNTSFADLPQSCASSGSIPGAFFPQKMKGHVLVDGGTMWDVNVDSAVNYCLDQGYTQEQVVIDMLICGIQQPMNQQVYGKAMNNWWDARHIKQYYNNLNSLGAELEAYPDINLRYFF